MKYFFLKINNEIVIFKSVSHAYFFRSNKGSEKSLKEPQMF